MCEIYIKGRQEALYNIQYTTYLIIFSLFYSMHRQICIHTVGKNIIATIKMRNNFCYPKKMVSFPKLRQQKLWLLISLLKFLYELCKLVHGLFSVVLKNIVFALPTIATAKVVALFTLLKALAKSNGNLFAIPFIAIIIISYFGGSNNIFVNCICLIMQLLGKKIYSLKL